MYMGRWAGCGSDGEVCRTMGSARERWGGTWSDGQGAGAMVRYLRLRKVVLALERHRSQVGVAHELYEGINTYLDIFLYKLLTEEKF